MNLSDVLGLRRHKRFLVDFDATVHERAHNLNLTARVGNISRDGLLFHSRDSFEPGALLDLSFRLAGAEDAPSATRLCVSGRVTRCLLRPDGCFFEVAVNFTGFHDGHEALFREGLARLAA